MCQLVGLHVEVERVAEEATREAAEDENIFTVPLDSTATLSFWENLIVHGYHFPAATRLVIISLDRINVLSGLVGDTAEYVDESVTHGARAVVMTADVHVGHFEPKIDIGVEHFALRLRVVLLLS